MIAYKVVWREQVDTPDEKLTSYGILQKAKVIYIPNQVVKPPVENSGLLCFETLEQAKKFTSKETAIAQIWRAEIGEIIPLGRNGTWEPQNDEFEAIRISWALPSREGDWPDGTIATKSVKLLTKVED